MIVLKILLYIFLAVLGIILLVLITPAGGEVSYIDGKLSYKVKLWVLNLADSEGGGVYGWLKKRKSSKKPPKIRHRKQRAVKKREPYEWEKELDDIPVNDSEELLPDEKSTENAAESENNVSETSAEADSTAADNITDNGQTAENNEKTDAPAEDDSDGFPDEESVGRTGSRKAFDEKIETLIGIWECAQRPMLKIFKGFKLSDLYIDFVIADEDAYDCALRYGRYSAFIYNGIAFLSQLFTVRLKTVDVRPAFGLSKGRWDVSGKFSVRAGTMVIAGVWFLITYIFRIFIPEKLRKRKMKKVAARQK